MKNHDFVEQWFSHSTEKFRRGNLHFSEKIFLSKNFMARKGISRLSLETFLSHTTEEILRGTFFSENFWIKKIASDEKSRFCRTMVFSQYRKFRRGNLHFSEKIFLSKNFMARKGMSRFSLKNFASQNRKN